MSLLGITIHLLPLPPFLTLIFRSTSLPDSSAAPTLSASSAPGRVGDELRDHLATYFAKRYSAVTHQKALEEDDEFKFRIRRKLKVTFSSFCLASPSLFIAPCVVLQSTCLFSSWSCFLPDFHLSGVGQAGRGEVRDSDV